MSRIARKKINNLSEIYDGNKLLINDFSNLDLQDIDLSSIPMEMWEDCIFITLILKTLRLSLYHQN